MSEGRLLPDQPIEFIKKCVSEGRLLWTYHVNMRLRGRGVPRRMILDSIGSYEIIESYPEDKYLPSYLVHARHGAQDIHVLFAADVAKENVRVVTAYFPDPGQWEADMKRRRR